MPARRRPGSEDPIDEIPEFVGGAAAGGAAGVGFPVLPLPVELNENLFTR